MSVVALAVLAGASRTSAEIRAPGQDPDQDALRAPVLVDSPQGCRHGLEFPYPGEPRHPQPVSQLRGCERGSHPL